MPWHKTTFNDIPLDVEYIEDDTPIVDAVWLGDENITCLISDKVYASLESEISAHLSAQAQEDREASWE